MFHEVNHVVQANNVIIVHNMSVFNSNFLKIRIYEIKLLLQIQPQMSIRLSACQHLDQMRQILHVNDSQVIVR